MRLLAASENGTKAQTRSQAKVSKHAVQIGPIELARRTATDCKILRDGAGISCLRPTALAQSKTACCMAVLESGCRSCVTAFAPVMPQSLPRLRSSLLRNDGAYLFKRLYYFLDGRSDEPMRYLVFNELGKSTKSHSALAGGRIFPEYTEKTKTLAPDYRRTVLSQRPEYNGSSG